MCRGACNEVWFDHEGLCIDTSSKLTYVMMKNHTMSSRGQKLRKSQLHFRERYVQEPLYIPKFEVAQMSTYYIPIDAEFYADFKNV